MTTIIVTGATGLVGAEVVRQAVQDKDIKKIIAIARSPIVTSDPKIEYIKHENFLEYNDLIPLFKRADACIWCLGVAQSQVNEDQYEIITHDYTIAAAKAMSVNKNIRLVFVSGGGADPTEKSSTTFARIKGKTENSLRRLPLQLIIARPGGIKPVVKNPKGPLIYKFIIPFYPLFELLTPQYVISSVELAHALLFLAEKGSDTVILENIALKKKAKEYMESRTA